MDHPPDGAGTLRAPSGWMLDRDGHRIVGASGVAQPLTNLEFLLLSMLESRSGAAVPIVELGDSLWGEGQWSRDMLYNAVKRARRKLDACDPDAGQAIVSVARTGYRLDRAAVAGQTKPAETRRRGWWLLAGTGATALLASVALSMGALRSDSPSAETRPPTTNPAADAITGRAVDAAGKPLSGVNVVACNGRTPDICPRTTTGADGNFEIALEQGVWQVSLRRDGQALATFVLATGVFHDVVVGDRTVAPGRLATATPSGTGKLAGRLVDAVEGIQVTACNAVTPNPCPFGYVAADGAFELHLPEGRYVVSFSMPGQSRPALSVAMNTGEPQEFHLPR